MILHQLTRCFPVARWLSGQRFEVLPTRVPKRLHEVAGSARIAEQDLLVGITCFPRRATNTTCWRWRTRSSSCRRRWGRRS